jgi:hypothetical protein
MPWKTFLSVSLRPRLSSVPLLQTKLSNQQQQPHQTKQALHINRRRLDFASLAERLLTEFQCFAQIVANSSEEKKEKKNLKCKISLLASYVIFKLFFFFFFKHLFFLFGMKKIAIFPKSTL